ncbi:AAA family ATPase [Catellatospora coxensis]
MVNASTVHIPRLRGRDREQQAIAELQAGAAGGLGAALLLHGDLGGGKTALLRHAAATVPDGTVRLWATGLDEESDLPYAGLQSLLQPVVDRIADLPAHQARALTRALSGEGCAADDRLALSMAVLTLLAALGRDHPVLCCVDDADALDRSSLDAIAFTARRIHAHRVTLLLTSTAELPLNGVPRVALRPLDPASGRAMLADLLHESGRGDDGGPHRTFADSGIRPRVGDDVLAALAALGGGNPRALTDLAASLSDSQLAGEAPLPTRLPADSALLRTYRARLDRLAPDTRWLLLLAAADEETDAAGLMRAAHSSGVDIAALTPAERGGLVRVSRGGIVFPQPIARALAYEEAPWPSAAPRTCTWRRSSTPTPNGCAAPCTWPPPRTAPTPSWPRSWRRPRPTAATRAPPLPSNTPRR